MNIINSLIFLMEIKCFFCTIGAELEESFRLILCLKILSLYRAEELRHTERYSDKRTFGFCIWIRYDFLNNDHIHHECNLINNFRVFRS